MKNLTKAVCLMGALFALSACTSTETTGPGMAGGRTAGNDTGIEHAVKAPVKAAPVKAEKIFKARQSK